MNKQGGGVGEATAAVFWGRRLFAGLSLGTGLMLVLMATPGVSEGQRTFAVAGTWLMASWAGVFLLVVWAVKLRLGDAMGEAASTLPLGPMRLLGGTFVLGLLAYLVVIVGAVATGQMTWNVTNILLLGVFVTAGVAGPVATLVQTYQLNARFPAVR